MGGLDGRSTALASIGGASPTLQLGVGGFAEEIATVGYRLSRNDKGGDITLCSLCPLWRIEVLWVRGCAGGDEGVVGLIGLRIVARAFLVVR